MLDSRSIGEKMGITPDPIPHTPLTFRASRFPRAAGIATGFALLLGSLRMTEYLGASKPEFAEILGCVFGGWVAIFVIWSLGARPQLEFSPEGLSITHGFHFQFIRWRQFKAITVRRVWLARRVCFEYWTGDSLPADSGSGGTPNIPAKKGHLPLNFGSDPDSLVELLMRHRHGTADTSSAS